MAHTNVSRCIRSNEMQTNIEKKLNNNCTIILITYTIYAYFMFYGSAIFAKTY